MTIIDIIRVFGSDEVSVVRAFFMEGDGDTSSDCFVGSSCRELGMPCVCAACGTEQAEEKGDWSVSANGNQVVTSEPERKRKRLGWDFNLIIARAHRLNNQLIGLQLTTGNLIALCLSAGQITAGVAALLWVKAGWWALLSVFLCFPLAVVIERLSLGGLMICRTVAKTLEALDAAYHLRVLKLRKVGQEPTEAEAYEHKRMRERLGRNRRWAVPIIVLGVVISGAVGDQIWQMVFQSLGGWWSLALSLCCALTISLTFVFSELFKEMADEGLVDIVQDDRIDLAVLAHSERGTQVDITMQAFANFRSDPKKNEREVGKVEKVIGARIQAFADYVEERGLGTVPGVPGGKEMKQIEARALSRRGFEARREDLKWYVQRYPNATCQMIASQFGVARSTAKAWLDRIRQEEQGAEEQTIVVDEYGVEGGQELEQ